MRKSNPVRMTLAFSAIALLGAPLCAEAGSFATDFNSGLPPGSALFGASAISPNDGTGGGYTNSGCLQLSGGLGAGGGAFIVTNDVDNATAVTNFAAAFKALIGGGDDAAGFSFNFAPDLPFAPISMDGAGTGLTVEFDPLITGAVEPAPAVDVVIAGNVVATAFYEGFQPGGFVDTVIQLNPNDTLDVIYDGAYIFSNLNLTPYSYAPAAGSLFGFGSTTDATNTVVFIDNLSLATSTTPGPFVDAFSPRGHQVQTNATIDIVLQNYATAVNPASITLSLDGSVVAPRITTNAGGQTTVHFAPPSAFAYSSAHSVSLAFADNTAPAPQPFTWTYGFTVAGAPFVPGSYKTLFSAGFETNALGALDKNPLFYSTPAGAHGPNYAPNGSGNPWFGPTPPNGLVMTNANGVSPHSGLQMLGGGAPGEIDRDWCNIAYRLGGGNSFTTNCMLDWWFYDPVGNAPNAADFEDYIALCSYSTAPTNTDYPASSTPADNGDLNNGLVMTTQYQRLSLGASGFIPAGGAYESSNYQARIVGAALGYGEGWIDTARQRSVGWHQARIILGPALTNGTTTVYFYIDDLTTPVYSGNSINSSGFNVIEINSAQAAAVGYFDDLSFGVATAATPPPPSVSARLVGKKVILTWPSGWALQSTPALGGQWANVKGASSPYSWDPTWARVQFFRLFQ